MNGVYTLLEEKLGVRWFTPKLETVPKLDRVQLPQLNGKWGAWPMGPGKPGLETMVLLCRDDPLPADVDLQATLGTFGEQSLQGQRRDAVAWFENGEMERNQEYRAPLVTPVDGSSPLERINSEIHKRAKRHFSYTRAITYGNEGGK